MAKKTRKKLEPNSTSSSTSLLNRSACLGLLGLRRISSLGGMIRQELYQLLKDEKDVHFTFGTARGNVIRHADQGMASSKFCLNVAGDTPPPSSNRLFDAIVGHCVPVIISDDIELPFEDVLDYSEFSIFVRASDAVKKGFLLKLLREIDCDECRNVVEIAANCSPF